MQTCTHARTLSLSLSLSLSLMDFCTHDPTCRLPDFFSFAPSLPSCGVAQFEGLCPLNVDTSLQLYIDGEFIGGTDIMIEMYENGEMKEMVEKVMAE